MEGLTAKVFRTYNASITLQQQLKELTARKYCLASRACILPGMSIDLAQLNPRSILLFPLNFMTGNFSFYTSNREPRLSRINIKSMQFPSSYPNFKINFHGMPTEAFYLLWKCLHLMFYMCVIWKLTGEDLVLWCLVKLERIRLSWLFFKNRSTSFPWCFCHFSLLR